MSESAASTGDRSAPAGSPSPLVADGLTEAAVDWLRVQLDGCIEDARRMGTPRWFVDNLRDARKELP